MFGLGASEMILLGVVALIVIGPKDLPGLFRAIGQFTGKARAMASEFSRAMEAAADESGVKDISKSIQAAANPKKFGLDQARKATGIGAGAAAGPATAGLSAERQATKDKMDARAAELVAERKARERAQFEADSSELLEDHELEDEPEPVEAAETAPQKDTTTT